MRLDLPQRPRRRLIGLTPLIDVVFILLLFFMLASNLTRQRAVPLDAPGQHSDRPQEQRALLLRIQAKGQLELSGEPVEPDALASLLRARLQRAPELRVVVQPADSVPLQTTLAVFDQIADAGVKVLRLR